MGIFKFTSYLSVFLAAFLLFQIELILAKMILPLYGGSYFVWGACLAFFQTVLLAGYAFAHFLVQKVGVSRGRIIHALVMALPLLGFPGRALSGFMSLPDWSPAVQIFVQLLVTIGPAFFALSTVSIFAQARWAAQPHLQGQSPYGLYALSNLGSFLGLFSYPLLMEIVFDVETQLTWWRCGYGVLVLGQVVSLVFSSERSVEKPLESVGETFEKRRVAQWLILGAAGTVLFVGTTNVLTMEVAPVPLMWVVPLGIYLASFIVCFREPSFFPRWLRAGIIPIMGVAITMIFPIFGRYFPFLIQLVLLLGILACCSVYCQGTLYELRPKTARGLTAFYLIISLGGMLGSLFVSWVVPLIADYLLEYFLGFVLLAFAMALKEKEFFLDGRGSRQVVLLMALMLFWPRLFPRFDLAGLLLLVGFLGIVFLYLRDRVSAFVLAVVIVTALAPILESTWIRREFLTRMRNHYGIFKVYDEKYLRALLHNTTLHGFQGLPPDLVRQPTSYFSKKTPVGEALQASDLPRQEVAVVGLGAGTLSAYVALGQRMDFYELDPDCEKIAREFFSFLKDAAGEVRIFNGDARLSFLNNQSARYDVIIIDAFTGDAIPVHLLTTEAIALYRQRLKPDGVILFHISNRYFMLESVLRAAGRELKGLSLRKGNLEEPPLTFASRWAMLTWSPQRAAQFEKQLGWTPLAQLKNLPEVRVWTDGYSSVLPIIVWQSFWSELKVFQSSLR